MVPASHLFGLRYSTCMAGTPSTTLSGGLHPTRFILGQVQISGWQLRSRYMLYMVKTKDLYLAYCPTGGCTHRPLFA